jgi:hypothetical protein
MKFETFNKRYRKGKKDNVWKACREALFIMKKSNDLIHDLKHVENVFKNIDIFLKKNKDRTINFDVLTLAVCWHDVYKAANGSNKIIRLIYNQFVEGIASSKIFRKNAKKYNFSRNILKQVCYAIRKHSHIQLLPRMTAEARVLYDGDKIDSNNYIRLKNTDIEKFILKKRFFLKFVIWYVKNRGNNLNYYENKPLLSYHKANLLTYLKTKL